MERNIRTYTISELEAALSELGQPKFRSKQLYEWIHYHHASSYDEMTNLPASLRSQLAESYPFSTPTVIDKQVSSDGTRKYVLEYADGCRVETVGMPSEENNGKSKRLTVCFSTQVGCAMECAFCATGREGFTRNLHADEIIDQIAVVQRDFNYRISNVVAMGQGEPFLNYQETLNALRELNNPKGFNIGSRRMTISTCGIIDGVKKLAEELEQFTLAISLHSAIQEKRDVIMPRVSAQPLKQLKKALSEYISKTNRRVTLEYLLMKNVNDGEEDLQQLREFCKGLLVHVNILPMNAVEGSSFQPAAKHVVKHWVQCLESDHIEATLRRSRGADISGACGQLKNKLH